MLLAPLSARADEECSNAHAPLRGTGDAGKVDLSRADAAVAYRLAVEWAAQGRADLAQRAHERVIAVEPDHRAARRALGFERVDGKWIAGDELWRAKGFVRVDGRWVLAAEVPATDANLARLRRAEAELRSARSEDRVAAAQDLGRLGDRRAVPILVGAWGRGESHAVGGYFAQVRQLSYVRDFDVEVACTSFIADPQLGVLQTGAVLAVRVVGTSRFPAAERDAYHRALVRVAGTDAGRTLGAWRAYAARLDAPPARTSTPRARPRGRRCRREAPSRTAR